MATKILVVYVSKYGATAEIAEKIGEVLRQEGLEADVIPTNRVGDPTQYDDFIIGSAVYIGQWRKDAVNFLKKNETILAGKPVWLFVSGPTGEGDATELMGGWIYPGKLKPVIEAIKPRDITVFHGNIDVKKLNLIEKFVIKMVKASTGDFRDWNAIVSWAKTISGELKK